MVEKTITRQKRERDLAANRSARYRQERADRPDVRAVDKALSEALVVYSRTLPPAECKTFIETMVRLTTAGLEVKGYSPKSSKSRTSYRLQTWNSSQPHSGSVRLAKERFQACSLRDAITV